MSKTHAALQIADRTETTDARPAIDVEDLYRRFGPFVLRRCRAVLKDEQLALDAMQETFVQLLRRADTLHAEAPGGLLYRIATNVCLLKLRSRRRHPESLGDTLLSTVVAGDSPARVGEARAVLARVFRDESESTKAMAVMHLVDGMTFDEVAAEVGLSRSGVRKRLRGLVARVAELTREDGETVELALAA